MLWKALGLFATALFASRWLVQLWYARRAGRPIVPRAFWYLSLAGSSLLLLYFTFGPSRDIVGVAGNALPFCAAFYNVLLGRRASA
jgi:lipid-A-disaccharide synthase-like uncharacterized protein